MGVTIQEYDDPTYDPYDADEINFGNHLDPYRVIASWRPRGAVFEGAYRDEMGLQTGMPPDEKHFVVIGTDAINTALTDTERFCNGAYKPTLGATFGMGSISTMDHPEHGRWRKIFQKIFLPQFVKTWGDTIVDPVVNTLMEKFIPLGHADLIEDFTLRYPFGVIYKQLNLPESDIRTFQRLALGQTDYVHYNQAVEAGVKLGDYFKQLVDARRKIPATIWSACWRIPASMASICPSWC